MLPRVFEMFAQADQSLERTQAGLGVGLSLARRLVELHGGTLEAQARASAAAASSSCACRRCRAAAPRRRRRRGARRRRCRTPGTACCWPTTTSTSPTASPLILRALDNDVRVAHDGAAALALAQAWQPHIAFLDIGLPRINGYDLARRAARRAATASMMLVAVTGWGQEKDRQLASRRASTAIWSSRSIRHA